MSNKKKALIVAVFYCLSWPMFYFIGCLASADLNIKHWWEGCRVSIAFLQGVATIVFMAITITLLLDKE